MAQPRKILVVDDDDHSRFLLTKTLLRRFPQLVMVECIQGSSAVTTATFEKLDLVVVHRAHDMDGITLVRALRQIAAALPIVLLSPRDAIEALEAGATRCLGSEEWLQIGVGVSDILSEKAKSCA